jgi:uncharacterized repeat protein (TIGR03847 family)
MVRRIHDFEPPERFVAGAVGDPGGRTFYLQARRGTELVSVALEKAQVALLAERLSLLLAEIERRGVSESVPATATDAELEEPVDEAFRVGTLSLSWDGERPIVAIEAQAMREEDETEDEPGERDWADDDPAGPDVLRVHISMPDAEAFSRRAQEVVSAGRPLCPMCGQPLDPMGHLCPRRNGHVAYLN